MNEKGGYCDKFRGYLAPSAIPGLGPPADIAGATLITYDRDGFGKESDLPEYGVKIRE